MPSLNPIWPSSGRYILAVSGGADSMVLLDAFAHAASERGYELVVAHFDHGLRADSNQDRQFVQAATGQRKLPFVVHQAHLGHSSEAAARTARHAWLEEVRVARQAAAILTAHHQDDLIETSLLNLARGSGRLGLAPMATSASILRPFIGLTRAELRAYAAANTLAWREDPTNADLSNPRNFLRHRLLPAASPAWRAQYLASLAELAELNTKIDQSISEKLEAAHAGPNMYSFPRSLVRSLDLAEVQEIIAVAARRLQPGIQLDRQLIGEIAQFVRTGQPHKFRPLRQGIEVRLTRDLANLTTKSPH